MNLGAVFFLFFCWKSFFFLSASKLTTDAFVTRQIREGVASRHCFAFFFFFFYISFLFPFWFASQRWLSPLYFSFFFFTLFLIEKNGEILTSCLLLLSIFQLFLSLIFFFYLSNCYIWTKLVATVLYIQYFFVVRIFLKKGGRGRGARGGEENKKSVRWCGTFFFFLTPGHRAHRISDSR